MTTDYGDKDGREIRQLVLDLMFRGTKSSSPEKSDYEIEEEIQTLLDEYARRIVNTFLWEGV